MLLCSGSHQTQASRSQPHRQQAIQSYRPSIASRPPLPLLELFGARKGHLSLFALGDEDRLLLQDGKLPFHVRNPFSRQLWLPSSGSRMPAGWATKYNSNNIFTNLCCNLFMAPALETIKKGRHIPCQNAPHPT